MVTPEVINVTLPEHDVRTFRLPEGRQVHGILAAPPCTEFAGSGARWWATKPPGLLQDAVAVATACLDLIWLAQPVWWAVENPVGRFRRLLQMGDPALVYNPCDYGDPWTKKTQVWGRFTVPIPEPVAPEGHRPGQPNAWYSKVGGKSARTKAYRSATPPGFARAFFRANP